MKKYISISALTVALAVLFAFATKQKVTKIYLIGDSTMADYSNYGGDEDYMKDRYPVTGWGQVFQPFFT